MPNVMVKKLIFFFPGEQQYSDLTVTFIAAPFHHEKCSAQYLKWIMLQLTSLMPDHRARGVQKALAKTSSRMP